MPKYSGKPGKGKHGVPDKQAHRVGKKWDEERERQEREEEQRKKG